jgi:hypothetical protein
MVFGHVEINFDSGVDIGVLCTWHVKGELRMVVGLVGEGLVDRVDLQFPVGAGGVAVCD